MIISVKVKVEIESVFASFGVRYWEDATINGVKDSEDGRLIPLKADNRWEIEVDVKTGRIKNWPIGTSAITHYKVCDDGIYRLFDIDGSCVYECEGRYVPGCFDTSDDKDGDYVILEIDDNGIIKGWSPKEKHFQCND